MKRIIFFLTVAALGNALLTAGLRAQPAAPDDLAQFGRKAALEKELGATHMIMTEGLPPAAWEFDQADPYPAWYMHHASLLKIFTPKDVQPCVNMEYAAKVTAILEKRCEILRKYGLEKAIDKVAEMCHRAGVAEERCVLEFERPGAETQLPPETWARGVGHSLERGCQFHHWEIANEPYSSLWGNGQAFPTPDTFIEHFKAVSSAIRAVDPQAQIGVDIGACGSGRDNSAHDSKNDYAAFAAFVLMSINDSR